MRTRALPAGRSSSEWFLTLPKQVMGRPTWRLRLAAPLGVINESPSNMLLTEEPGRPVSVHYTSVTGREEPWVDTFIQTEPGDQSLLCGNVRVHAVRAQKVKRALRTNWRASNGTNGCGLDHQRKRSWVTESINKKLTVRFNIINTVQDEGVSAGGVFVFMMTWHHIFIQYLWKDRYSSQHRTVYTPWTTKQPKY